MLNHNMDAMFHSIQIGGKMAFDQRTNLYARDATVRTLNAKDTITSSGATFNGDVNIRGALIITPDVPASVTDNITTLLNTTYEYCVIPADSPQLPLIRLTPVNYADGIGSVSGSLINPRVISNAVVAQTVSELNSRNCTDMFWLIGQFTDHDLDLTNTGSEAMNIQVPTGDPFFDPESTGTVVIPFKRSLFNAGVTTPREFFTEITYELDASNIYGSFKARADWLRAFWNGKLKTGLGNTVPVVDIPKDGALVGGNAGPLGKNCYLAGDVRANENTALLSMHTLWVREHNWWADRIYEQDMSKSDEQIYQLAKVMVESEFQSVVYNEFLPLLIGPNALPAYTGYKPEVSPAISIEFSTAAFRLGHSLLSEVLLRLNNDNTTPPSGDLPLLDAFFAPDIYANNGDIGIILRGAARNICQKIDTRIVGAVRNFLFGPPGAGGHDLAALNIQRGRDHGISDYNSARVALGMTAKMSFNEITDDSELASALETVYGGDLNIIDMWVGGLAETPVSGSQVGELFQYILVDQFTRTRDGDNCFYKNRLPPSQIDYVESITLSQIIERNTCAKNLQNFVMQLN